MPIDYSKWDHLDDCSDSDEEGAADTRSTPRVTRLEAPSRVTFGGMPNEVESVATIDPPLLSTLPPSSNSSGAMAQDGHGPMMAPKPSTASDNEGKCSETGHSAWTKKGGSVVTSDNRHLYWSQDRYSVQIRLELRLGPPKESVERVVVDGILPYADRYCATGSQKPRLIITGRLGGDLSSQSSEKSTATLLEGELPYPVHWSQDDEQAEAKSLDWIVERHPSDKEQRFALITLYKAVPMQGLFVWWKRPLLQFDEVTLEDGNSERSAASNEFIQAWDEAHRIFRETKRPQPQTLPS